MPAPASPRRLIRLAALAASAIALAGCSSLRPTQKAFAPDEYDRRHPIQLVEAPVHLDVFATGPKLDRRQQQDIEAFAKDYLAKGRSGLTASVPVGGHYGRALPEIRAILARAGVGNALRVTGYPVGQPGVAAPIRLTYTTLQAKLGSECGLWPSDLAGSKGAETWHNRPYHNLGCAYQSMIAAQVAEPVDLVRPRGEGPIDVTRRAKDIEAVRKGEDPSTKWAKDDVKVKEAAQ